MSFTRRFPWMVAVAVFVIACNVWVASAALAKLFDAERWLAHSLEVLTATSQAQLAMSSSSNAARGYLLVGEERFSQRFQATSQQVETNLNEVARLTLDNKSQQNRTALLRERSELRLNALRSVMLLRGAHPQVMLSEAQMQPALADSIDEGPTVRYMFEQVEGEEHRLLSDRYEEAHHARHRVVTTFATASLLDLLLLGLAFWLVHSVSRAREQVLERSREVFQLNAELGALNAVLEERVHQRTQELEVSNQELQAFSYSVSHDLRAPLRTIDGFSLALEEDYGSVLNDEGRDYIRRVRTGVQRMGMLIDALLQLSRVTRAELRREPVNLSELAGNVFSELMQLETGREVEFLAEPHLTAEADPQLMRVAFENLLGNALKFTSKTPQARIELGHRKHCEETVYFIRDNGAGFDMQYVDRLFTAFQRLHGDRDFKGSGIGLATVSRIIRRHQGRIWAEGSPGSGALFSFTLSA